MKQHLTSYEFAIDGAGNNIKINDKKVELTFTKVSLGPNVDAVQMNLSMVFEVDPNKIQIGPGPIKLGGCGVLLFDKPTYFEGRFSDFILTIEGDSSNYQFFLKSANNDIAILTDGIKGEHGTSFM